MMSARDLEKRSSAVTLSDMEIFVFPELMYALPLANLMSPRIWKWREDPWFNGLAKMKPYRASMKIDYDERRPMEVEAIFGNPLRAIESRGASAPVLETIYRQLKFLDERNLRASR